MKSECRYGEAFQVVIFKLDVLKPQQLPRQQQLKLGEQFHKFWKIRFIQELK